MRIVTINVNGVRAALRKGMQEWLDGSGADVVCLQEVRAPEELVREAFAPGWHVVLQECEIKGRAGVAILSRTEPTDALVGAEALGDAASAALHTGRWVEATIASPAGPVRVVSVYVHSGEAGTPKMDSKYEFLDLMSARLATLTVGVRQGGGDGRHQHRPHAARHQELEGKPQVGWLPARGARLPGPVGRVAMGRRSQGNRGTTRRPIHVVVDAGQGLRYGHRLADRLPVRDAALWPMLPGRPLWDGRPRGMRVGPTTRR